MANIINEVQRPALVIVYNKTLAAQLSGEFKELFPNNRVEFFISNFDFYRPESYMPKDWYIYWWMMKCRAVNSLIERRDTIVVCFVAAIYGLGDPDEYGNLVFSLKVGEKKLMFVNYVKN